MKILNFTLTGDELLEWIHALSGEKKKRVLRCFREAKKDGGGLLIDGIGKIENLLCFTVLIYCECSPHATKALSFQAPCTPRGRKDLESALRQIKNAMGGFPK